MHGTVVVLLHHICTIVSWRCGIWYYTHPSESIWTIMDICPSGWTNKETCESKLWPVSGYLLLISLFWAVEISWDDFELSKMRSGCFLYSGQNLMFWISVSVLQESCISLLQQCSWVSVTCWALLRKKFQQGKRNRRPQLCSHSRPSLFHRVSAKRTINPS